MFICSRKTWQACDIYTSSYILQPIQNRKMIASLSFWSTTVLTDLGRKRFGQPLLFSPTTTTDSGLGHLWIAKKGKYNVNIVIRCSSTTMDLHGRNRQRRVASQGPVIFYDCECMSPCFFTSGGERERGKIRIRFVNWITLHNLFLYDTIIVFHVKTSVVSTRYSSSLISMASVGLNVQSSENVGLHVA